MAETAIMLDYEKLDVYRCAIDNLAFAMRTIPRIPKEYAALADQWRRASMSVPLNIAEAVGKKSTADRQNRYAIARGEAMECAAILDVVRLLRIVPDDELTAAKQIVARVTSMLSKMCR